MSHFLKSVLFGLAGAALGLLAVYLAEQFQNRRAGKHPLYDAEYVFSFPSNTNSNSQADPRPIDVVKKRLSSSGYDHELSEEGGERYRLTASGVHDSTLIFKLLTSPGRLTFIEPYTPEDLYPAFTTADSLLHTIYKSQLQLPPPTTDTVNLPVPDVKYDDPTTYSERPLFSLMHVTGDRRTTRLPRSHLLIQKILKN